MLYISQERERYLTQSDFVSSESFIVQISMRWRGVLQVSLNGICNVGNISHFSMFEEACCCAKSKAVAIMTFVLLNIGGFLYYDARYSAQCGGKFTS